MMNFDSEAKWLQQPNQTRTGATKKCGGELAVFVNENMSKFFKGIWDQSGFLGSNSAFLIREQSVII